MPSQTSFYLRLSAEDAVAPLLLDGRPAFAVSEDGRAVLWCNEAGARLFEAASIPVLLRQGLSADLPFCRQVGQIVRSLPFGRRRLEMLRLPSLRARPLSASCRKLRPEGGPGVLLIAAASAAAGREPMEWRAERLATLLADAGGAAALLAADGRTLGASPGFADIDRRAIDGALAGSAGRPAAARIIEDGFERRLEAGAAALPEGFVTIVLVGKAEAAAAVTAAPLAAELPDRPAVQAGPAADPVPPPPPPAETRSEERQLALAEEMAATAPVELPSAAESGDGDRIGEAAEAAVPEPETEPAVEDVALAAKPAAAGEVDMEPAAAEAGAGADFGFDDSVLDDGLPEVELTGDETAGLPLQAETPSIEAETADASAIAVPAPERGDPVRFVFQMDDRQHFTMVSPEFAAAVGPRSADIVGRSFAEIVETLRLTDSDAVDAALNRRDTWSGVTVYWPVDGADYRVAVDLAALPAFSRERSFEGFRGFGVCRLADRRIVGAPAGGAPGVTESLSERPGRPAPTGFVPTLIQGSAERSNVVRLPTAAAGDRPGRPAALTGNEQDAFRRIAEALGAQGPGEAPEPAGEGIAAAAPPAAGEAAAGPGERTPDTAPPPAARSVPPDLRILDRLPLGVLVLRADRILFANRAFLDLLGYASAEAFSASGGLDALFEIGARGWIADQDERRVRELVARRADGTELPVEARLQTAPLGEGTVLVLSLRQRIAPAPAMNELSAELRAATARVGELEAILDTATDGVVVVGRDGRIVNFNRAAEALFAVEASDALGEPFVDLLAEESRKPALDYLDGLAENGVASVLNDGREVIGRVADRGLIPLFMTMGRIGASELYCAVLRDITQWKKAEEDLIAARRAAEAANTQKSEFLAKISHEIRTPLNAVIGFSEVMMEERFGPIGNERYREYLRDIHVSGSHLMSLINDLLDLSKIEAGKIELSFDAVAVNGVIQECVALMQPQANRERIIIRTSLGHELPNVVADPRSLRQIVLNLLSNAVKFTMPGGQVIVSSSLEESGEVVIRIRDTGVGMSEKDLEAAMKPFRQLATSGRERFDGTGLGLPLTKALVEANRATFTIDSAVNQGTMVRIAFPPPRVLAG